MTAPKATVLAGICSLVSAVLVAWITGAFDRSKALNQAEIMRLKDQAVEQIRQEGATKTEEIRQLTAKMVEETKSEGSIKIEKFKLQRDLILEAINTRDREESQKRLRFFAETGLIPDFAEKVLNFTMKKPINEIPTISDYPPPRLQPLGYRHEAIAMAVVEFMRFTDNTPFCAGLTIAKDKVLLLEHCLLDQELEDYAIRYTNNSGLREVSKVIKATQVKTTGTKRLGERMTILTLAKADAQPLGEINIRKPKLGEQVFIVGRAPRNQIGYRSIGFEGYGLFLAENCAVKEVETYVGTDCPTGIGTSGNPIFAESDGALLSLVAWGRGTIETNGPLLVEVQAQLLDLVRADN